jgi:outer membrane protein, heavy metal efflux system
MNVKSPSWPPNWGLACVFAGFMLAVPPVAAQPDPSDPVGAVPKAPVSRPTWAQALAAAWERSTASAEAMGRLRQVSAAQRQAEAWLAAAPSLALSQREGRGEAARGARETEVGLALPLWRPGLRDLHAQAAQADSDWALASERAARLGLAARLRDQFARVRLAEVEATQAARQHAALQALGADVDRRVDEGDLARTDAMAAQADVLAARTLARETELAWATERRAWTVLTGLTDLPDAEASLATDGATVDAQLDAHPDAQLAEAAAHRARQHVAQVQAQGGAAPELGISLRRDQPGTGQPRQSSVALSLRLPLGTDTQNASALAAALAEQDLASMGRPRLRQQLDADLAQARQQLAAAVAQLDAKVQRAALLRERARLLDLSFRAGESPLSELLRAMSSASQADAAASRQRVALSQAQARLHQALGHLP